MVLVDTSIWSLAFRRFEDKPSMHVSTLAALIRRHQALMIGPIRQEILSGISVSKKFQLLKERLSVFQDLPILTEDYERAADFFNICRSKGIQGSNTDFLICAVANRNKIDIFSNDKDFHRYKKHLKISLFEV